MRNKKRWKVKRRGESGKWIRIREFKKSDWNGLHDWPHRKWSATGRKQEVSREKHSFLSVSFKIILVYMLRTIHHISLFLWHFYCCWYRLRFSINDRLSNSHLHISLTMVIGNDGDKEKSCKNIRERTQKINERKKKWQEESRRKKRKKKRKWLKSEKIKINEELVTRKKWKRIKVRKC